MHPLAHRVGVLKFGRSLLDVLFTESPFPRPRLLDTMHVGTFYSSCKSVIAVLSQRRDGSIPVQHSICKHNACSRQLSFPARPPAAHRLPCLVCNAARQSVPVEVCTFISYRPVCYVSFLACRVTFFFCGFQSLWETCS